MAVVTSDFLEGLRTTFRALFATEFQAALAFQGWREFVLEVPSDSEQNSYNWFGTVPRMTDVTQDTVAISDLGKYNFSIVNREFQAALEVSRAALERDRLSLITPRIGQLGLEAARHPGELAMELIKDNPTCFTGKAYFANDHVIGKSGTIDNLFNGTGVTPVSIRTDLNTARSAMRKFKDDQGRPMNLTPNFIMVPVELEYAMVAALTAETVGLSGTTPILPPTNDGLYKVNNYTIMVNPYLVDNNNWYAFHVGAGANRPVIYQVEKAPVLEGDTNPNSRENIIQRQFLYSVYGRYNAGVTDPRFGISTAN